MLQGSALVSTPSRSLCWPSQSELYHCTPLEHNTLLCIYPCKCPLLLLSACWGLYTNTLHSGSQILGHPWGSHFKTLPEGPQGQNYFHDDTKLLLFFLTFLFSWIYSTHGSSRGYMIRDLATDRMQSRYEIPDPSSKRDMKDIGEKCRTMALFLLDIKKLKKFFFDIYVNM